MEHKKAVIIANGQPPGKAVIAPYLDQADMIIAADGGSRTCMQLQIEPDFILGDFDSIDRHVRSHFSKSQFLLREDQNYTDLQKALRFCRETGVRIITLFSVFGRRNDHASGNLIIFESFDADIELTAVDDYGQLRRLFPGRTKLSGQPGATVSLFSLRPVVNLSLSGFKYALSGQDYAPFFLGISNEFSRPEAEVSFDQGRLLVYEMFNESREP